MGLPVFPRLPGQGWSVTQRTNFSTRIASHVSGRETRAPYYARPLHEFELTWDGLESERDPAFLGLGLESLQTLRAFYSGVMGQYGVFLYVDPNPSNSVAAGAPVAVGDGVTTSFTLLRPIGAIGGVASYEAASWVTALGTVTVAGVATTSTLTTPNRLSFPSAPSAGAQIAATFSYGFCCRFLDDAAEFEQFMKGLWSVKALKFKQVREAPAIAPTSTVVVAPPGGSSSSTPITTYTRNASFTPASPGMYLCSGVGIVCTIPSSDVGGDIIIVNQSTTETITFAGSALNFAGGLPSLPPGSSLTLYWVASQGAFVIL